MERAETTRFLGELLVSSRFSGMGKYWASEASIDAFTTAGKGGRVDFMQFEPPNQYAVSSLEKGIFICYEIKSCKEDVYSGNKDILSDLNDRTFEKHLIKTNPESSKNFGIIVAVPWMRDKYQEFEEPTRVSDAVSWRLEIIKPCIVGSRKKSMTEMLFCMMRSGH